ncbi:STORAGE PROTEIN [Salix koriyanagi]|uniref:STORAGE PROTEIN n=1 Tax=Salix koriyanagi TaxID=2511006 RepID=A0A9Q0PNR1_9ROSI|nr:STORAGE PROTEIN [Salix koriyanagi]KAJ6691407.1 STORAGE PROTEIN [Salix koriyanagi]KAJ6691408.1 STORAGE PROTEIN [Salix koriyanagi]
MPIPIRSGTPKKPSEMTRLFMTTFIGIIFGFFLGISFPTLSLSKMNLPSSLFPSIDLTYIEDKYSGISKQALFNAWSSLKGNKGDSPLHPRYNETEIWVPTNPRGAERLPPGIVASESDFYLRRLWGLPSEDLTIQPRYLVTFTVGYDQKKNIDAAVKKFSENFTIVLFHYDGRTTEWDEFEWSKRTVHISAHKQTKWWYAKRFLHPDIVAPYDYIFLWDEDLGVEHFDAEKYIKLVRKYGLEISQPGLDPDRGTTWAMTKRRDGVEVHKDTEERPGWCTDPHLPPCAAFVEIMATVFSRDAWRCVWHMIQNDLVHGWGLDFAMRKCVEPAHEKIGVVDAQWIIHQGVPSLGSQGQEQKGKAPWEGVRERCRKEWTMFQDRMTNAEKVYYKAMEIDPPNSTAR